MSEAVATPAGTAPEPEEKGHPVRRILIIVAVVIVVGALANLLGWDIRGWFHSLWTTLTSISVEYIVAGVVLGTLQTTLTAFAWYSILRYAYGDGVKFLPVLAAYAASVGMNNVLPANLGTLVLFVMFTSLIPAATFAGILGGYAVEKIFFTLAGAFVYLYLFLAVGGSFDIGFGWIKKYPVAVTVMLLGGVFLLYLVLRSFWPRVVKWWDQAKDGGQILAHPGAYFGRVFLPSLLAWLAMLGVNAVFMSAYDIPVTFHTLMSVVGSNSLANVTSVTPGGAGVTQAWNVAALSGVTSSTNATAYSVAQQLVMTAWTIIFGIAMMVWAFGWHGGKKLLTSSYEEAKVKAEEQKAAREAKKAEKAAAAGADAAAD